MNINQLRTILNEMIINNELQQDEVITNHKEIVIIKTLNHEVTEILDEKNVKYKLYISLNVEIEGTIIIELEA